MTAGCSRGAELFISLNKQYRLTYLLEEWNIYISKDHKFYPEYESQGRQKKILLNFENEAETCTPLLRFFKKSA